VTKIEWVKNPDGSQGITVNSKTGCLNHTPEGLCLGGLFPCYAWKLAHGRLRIRYQANWNFPPGTDVHKAIGDTFYPRWWPERLEQIKGIKKPTGIFLDDMSDWMGDYWPEEWTKMELQVMKDCPQHRFYTLTKQPQNLPQWSPFPENCWVGVTATNRRMLLAAREVFNSPICAGGIMAKVKFISFEPLLESAICDHQWKANIKGGGFSRRRIESDIKCTKCGQAQNWGNLNSDLIGSDGKPIVQRLIIGAQTRPKKLPAWEGVKEIIEAADQAGVRVFLKDNLGLPRLNCDGATPFYRKDTTGTMVLRQEMP
jgi:protein gp37